MFSCAKRKCTSTDSLRFPRLPNPEVMDGLEARLNLIEWSWRTGDPTESEVEKVSLLRGILSRLGHLSREPEPETDTGPFQQPKPTINLMRPTFLAMRIAASGPTGVKNEETGAKVAPRGMQDYCSYDKTSSTTLCRRPARNASASRRTSSNGMPAAGP